MMPWSPERLLLDNPPQAWLQALLAGLVAYAALLITQRVVVGQVTALARKTDTRLDDLAAELAGALAPWFFAVAALAVGTLLLELPLPLRQGRNGLLLLALLVQGGLLGSRVVAFWLEDMIARREGDSAAMARTMAGPLRFIALLALWTVLLLVFLDNMGMNVTALVTGLGIGGIAVALAVQNILGDLLAAFSIILDRPFVVGDTIAVEAFTGTVEHIGLKTTRLRSLGGEEIVFANGELLKSRIRNYKSLRERRMTLAFRVAPDTPKHQVQAIAGIVAREVAAQPGARFERAHLVALTDTGPQFEAVFVVTEADYARALDIQQAVLLGLLAHFETEGIACGTRPALN